MTDIEQLKKELDNWIKDINSRLSDIERLLPTIEEMMKMIDHNNELATLLHNDQLKLKEEISVVRLVQLLAIKREGKK